MVLDFNNLDVFDQVVDFTIFNFKISSTNFSLLIESNVGIESWKVFFFLSVWFRLMTHFFNWFLILVIIWIEINYHLAIVFVLLFWDLFADSLDLRNFFRLGLLRWMTFSFLFIVPGVSFFFFFFTFRMVIRFFTEFGWEGNDGSLIKIVGFLEDNVLWHV